MPTFTTLDQIFLVVAFLVPGFVFSSCRSLFMNRSERQGAEIFIRYLTFSTFNLSVFAFFLYYPLSGTARETLRPWMWFFIIFVSPTICGMFAGYWQREGIGDSLRKKFPTLERMIAFLGLRFTHPIGNAWDWRLGRIDPCWVIVSLKDGTEWSGYFGRDSFASSEAIQRDMYIQTVYTRDDEEKWHATDSSVWLAGSEISSIQFFSGGEAQNDIQ